jgi:hypothetical protein
MSPDPDFIDQPQKNAQNAETEKPFFAPFAFSRGHFSFQFSIFSIHLVSGQ